VPCVSFSPESERHGYPGVRHPVAISAISHAPLTDTPTRTPCGSTKQNDPGQAARVFALPNYLSRHHGRWAPTCYSGGFSHRDPAQSQIDVRQRLTARPTAPAAGTKRGSASQAGDGRSGNNPLWAGQACWE
jgi:hypothetical protein